MKRVSEILSSLAVLGGEKSFNWLDECNRADLLLAAFASPEPPQDPSETTPSAFDGAYVTNPEPGLGGDGVEWWWFQAVVPTSSGVVAEFDAQFYRGKLPPIRKTKSTERRLRTYFDISLGFIYTDAPTDPKWRFDVSGVFPNGTFFFIDTPVDTPAIIDMPGGEAVNGNWGDLGTFSISADRSTIQLNFNSSATGVEGTVTMKNNGPPAHNACSNNITDPPYFQSAAQGVSLSPSERILIDQLGWAVTAQRTTADINLTIQGTPFQLTNATGYHDHNWGPVTFDTFIYTWLSGQGSCGPYDLTYVEVQALNSTRERDVLKGYLAKDGQVLQNQCSLYGSQSANNITVTPTGEVFDAATNQTVPTGLNLDYDIAGDGSYHFELYNSVIGPDVLVYRRWRLGGKGGKVGEEQYDCGIFGDWLNPGVALYSQDGPGLFEQQSSAKSGGSVL